VWFYVCITLVLMSVFTFVFIKAVRWMEGQHTESKKNEEDEDYAKMMDQESNQEGKETGENPKEKKRE